MPVRLNTLQAGGTCAAREDAGLQAEPFFAALASSRTWISQEVGVQRFAGRAGSSGSGDAAELLYSVEHVGDSRLRAKANGQFLEI